MIAGDAVLQAIDHKKVPEAKRRVIAALMLLHDCGFEEAAAGLDAAVQERLQNDPPSVQWQGSFCLTAWVMNAGMQLQLARQRQETGRVLRLVPRGAR